ncbi:hypothetical protein BDW02DRAFT_567744 [Decorospora gaudefroyi]|uniref:Uncharacterized protein n=1 Tax=Decorospora gaudefroyi TaxID=184978 RepID=A0A6A5KIN5_9PLEO|nr:hypothetical protein BDW02DRAFT_567744 [Decorospora gaudefroyi]
MTVGPTPTAVTITGMFSASPWPPLSSDAATFNGTSTITSESTTTILVTATLAPSIGTGLPISNTRAAPLWTNSSYAAVPTPILSTGGLPTASVTVW